MFLKVRDFYRRRSEAVWGAAVFGVSFSLYAATAPRTIFLNDNPEFVTAAAVAGVPHPSGYPLYVILTWLFSRLPFGDLPYRVNIFSAFCSALVLVFVYYILKRIFSDLSEYPVRPYLAAAAAMPFAASGVFWSQSIIGKTYPLNLLLILACGTMAIKFRESKNVAWAYAFFLLAGLGLSNHLMFALGLPFLAAFFIRRKFWNPAIAARCMGLLALGLTPYLYLPIRAAAEPALNWGHIHDWESFVRMVTRAQYGDVGGLADAADKMLYLSSFAMEAWAQFKWLLVFLPVGIAFVFKRSRPVFLLLAAVSMTNVFGIIAIRNSLFNYANAEFNAPYYLPAYLALFMLSVSGAWFLADRVKRFSVPMALVFSVAAFAAMGYYGLPANDLRNFRFVENLSREALESLPPDAVLVVSLGGAASDTRSFSYLYQKAAKNVRPDVSIVGLPDVFPQRDGNAAIAAYEKRELADRRRALYEYAASFYPGRPIYATFPYRVCTGSRTACPPPLSNGYAYALNGSAFSGHAAPIEPSENDRRILERSIFGQQYLADHYYAVAALKLQKGDSRGAKEWLIKAIAQDPLPGSVYLKDFQELRQFWEAAAQEGIADGGKKG